MGGTTSCRLPFPDKGFSSVNFGRTARPIHSSRSSGWPRCRVVRRWSLLALSIRRSTARHLMITSSSTGAPTAWSSGEMILLCAKKSGEGRTEVARRDESTTDSRSDTPSTARSTSATDEATKRADKAHRWRREVHPAPPADKDGLHHRSRRHVVEARSRQAEDRIKSTVNHANDSLAPGSGPVSQRRCSRRLRGRQREPATGRSGGQRRWHEQGSSRCRRSRSGNRSQGRTDGRDYREGIVEFDPLRGVAAAPLTPPRSGDGKSRPERL